MGQGRPRPGLCRLNSSSLIVFAALVDEKFFESSLIFQIQILKQISRNILHLKLVVISAIQLAHT